MNLATLAGQASHYSAVRARLMGTMPEARVDRLAIPEAPEPKKPLAASEKQRAQAAKRRSVMAMKAAAKLKGASVLASSPLPMVTVEAYYAWEGGPEMMPPPVPLWKQIVIEVAERERIPVLDLMSDFREKHVVAARAEIFYRIRHECGLSYVEIGKRMGNRDHSTVIWGCRRHAEKLAGRE